MGVTSNNYIYDLTKSGFKENYISYDIEFVDWLGENPKKSFICLIMLVISYHVHQKDIILYDTQDELSYQNQFHKNDHFDMMMQNLIISRTIVNRETLFAFDRHEKDYNEKNYKLFFNVKMYRNRVHIELHYNSCLFTKEHMEYFLQHLKNIMQQIRQNSKIKYKDMHLLSENEKLLLIEQFQQNAFPFEKRLVMEQFYEQALKNPNKVAIELNDEYITYKELLNKVTILAKELRSYGVTPNKFVAIYAERSIEMIISIFAVLTAGGAYCPIDINCPKHRIQYILHDLDPTCILLVHRELPVQTMIPTIYVDKTLNTSNEQLYLVNSMNDICYCIYTSGTTGVPKGSIIKHFNLVNLLKAYEIIYNLSPNDVVLQVSNYTFDQSVWDIFGILAIGGRLCLIDKELLLDPEQLGNYCCKHNITIASFTPVLINELEPSHFPTLRILDSSGEPANIVVLRKWVDSVDVINTYGPTETTVNASSYIYHGENFRAIPIGAPIINTQFYVLNENGKLQGAYMPGELYIAGDGVGSGYLNDEINTKKKFLNNPFGDGLIYKTGDLVRWLANGTIDYLHRLDEQIKIRGYRIELEDIESCLRQYAGVDEAGVAVKKVKEHKVLYGFITVNKKFNGMINLKKYMDSHLPYYMIPNRIFIIKKLPLSFNGKLDRNALLKLAVENKVSTDNANGYSPFITLCMQVFCNILELSNIDIKDRFIERGGNSISACRISCILRKHGYHISAIQILQSETIEVLNEYIMKNKSYNCLSNNTDYDGKYNLTPCQTSFYQDVYKNREMQIMQILYSFPNCNEKRLINSLKILVNLYDIFSINFERNGCKVYQRFSTPQAEIIQKTFHDDSEFLAYQKSDRKKSFNYSKGALARFAIIKIGKNVKLFITISHLIIDGCSFELLMKKLSEIYINYDNYKTSIDMDVPKFQKYLKEYSAKDDLQYWDMKLYGYDPNITIPHNQKIGTCEYSKIECYMEIDESMKSFCRINNITLNILFEVAYAFLLSDLNYKKDVSFNKVDSGRNLNIEGIESMVGMFIHIFPQRIKITESFTDICIKVHKNNILEHKYIYSDLSELDAMQALKTIFVFTLSYSTIEDNIMIYETEWDQDDVDVVLYVEEQNGKFHIYAIYNASCYTSTYMKMVLQRYIDFIGKVLKDFS